VALAAFVAAGVYVAIGLLAAVYRIADLWYRIGASWPRVVRGLVAWAGAALALALLAGRPARTAFLIGLGGYAAFHVALFVTLRAYVRGRVRARRAS
jgi:hypothetical protein